jgi:hypothetical protein
MNKNTQKAAAFIAAVQAMHAAEDRGHDPYDSMRVRTLTLGQVAAMRRQEAEGILACYETNLALVRS